METIFKHRSVRKFRPDPVPAAVMERLLLAASRASTTGNMQLYSIIVTTGKELKEKLSVCHSGQPMVTEAPAVVTFCADVHRFSRWCEIRGAKPEYHNLVWFMSAAIDTLLASQNFSLEAENQGLGICYMGTTLYSAEEIIEILDLPMGVIPVATVALGYPRELPPLTDRLPVEAIVHYEKYKEYTPQKVEELWQDKEASEETARLIEENGLPNLARIFTERRYRGEESVVFSEKYLNTLKKQGFI